MPKIGRVLDADPERRLRWVWRPLGGGPNGDGATEVLVDFEPTDEPIPGTATPGTVITVA